MNTVNDWIELKNGSCTAKFLQLPTNQDRYGISSLRMTAQRLRLSLRYILKLNDNNDLRNIWKLSAYNNIPLDSLIEREPTKSLAILALQSEQLTMTVDFISSLTIQGKLFSVVNEAFDGATIRKWSSVVSNLLPDMLF